MYQGGNSSAMANIGGGLSTSWKSVLETTLKTKNWETQFYMLLASVLRGYWVTDHAEITDKVRSDLLRDLVTSDDEFVQPWRSGESDTINRLLDLIKLDQPVNWMMRNNVGGYNSPIVGHASISAFSDLDDRVVAEENRKAISEFYAERTQELRLLNLAKESLFSSAIDKGHRFTAHGYDIMIYGPSVTPLKESALFTDFLPRPRKVALLEINHPALEGAISYLQSKQILRSDDNFRGAPFERYQENYYGFSKSQALLRMDRTMPRVGVMLGRTITNDNMLGALKIFRESLDYILVDFLNPVVGEGIEAHYGSKYLKVGFVTLARNGVARYLPSGQNPKSAHIQGRLLTDYQLPLDIERRETVPIQIYSLGYRTTEPISILNGLVQIGRDHFLPGLNISAITPENFAKVANAAGWDVMSTFTQPQNGCAFRGSVALLYNRDSQLKPTQHQPRR